MSRASSNVALRMPREGALPLQVVVGVLGCPNLPQKRIEDADGVAESASKAGTDGVGVIFAAERNQGAFAGPLSGPALTPPLPGSPDLGTSLALGQDHVKLITSFRGCQLM